MTQILAATLTGLSVVNIGASSLHLSARFADDGSERYEIVLPPVSFAAIEDHAQDLIDALYAERGKPGESQQAFEARVAADTDGELFEILVSRFRDSDAREQWADGFDPIMNSYWPVDLSHDTTAEQAAALIDQFAPVCTLICFRPDDGDDAYGIALSGGGMDLSDKIAIAYLCCGGIPPLSLLTHLNGVIDAATLAEVAPRLEEAYGRAQEYLTHQISNLKTTAERLFDPNRVPA